MRVWKIQWNFWHYLCDNWAMWYEFKLDVNYRINKNENYILFNYGMIIPY